MTFTPKIDELYLPGVCREVTQFCKACATCQRTNQNIKVVNTHCYSDCVPQRSISSKEVEASHRSLKFDP